MEKSWNETSSKYLGPENVMIRMFLWILSPLNFGASRYSEAPGTALLTDQFAGGMMEKPLPSIATAPSGASN